MATFEAAALFQWTEDGSLVPMSRPAAVANAALWCWTKAARRFLESEGAA